MGDFSSLDGTMEFFTRVNALLQPHFKVLDFGAGRGSWFWEDEIPFRRSLRDIRSKVAEYIGVDVDEAVLQNATTSRNMVLQEGRIPLGDESIDMIICDYVLEHINDVEAFRAEIDRVLKSGGIFCGRTPHACNYASIVARLIKNRNHAKLLAKAQPNRRVVDVFPSAYRCNTLSAVARLFRGWENRTYLYAPEPAYFFGSKAIFRIMSAVHRIAPTPIISNLYVFVRKKRDGDANAPRRGNAR